MTITLKPAARPIPGKLVRTRDTLLIPAGRTRFGRRRFARLEVIAGITYLGGNGFETVVLDHDGYLGKVGAKEMYRFEAGDAFQVRRVKG